VPEIGTPGLMSGDGKRGVGHRPQATAPILDSTLTEMGESHEIDPNDAYRVLMDRQHFRSRRNFFIARKRKLKGGATPLVRARPKVPAMRLDDRTAY
jgi:hypothetical protein